MTGSLISIDLNHSSFCLLPEIDAAIVVAFDLRFELWTDYCSGYISVTESVCSLTSVSYMSRVILLNVQIVEFLPFHYCLLSLFQFDLSSGMRVLTLTFFVSSDFSITVPNILLVSIVFTISSFDLSISISNYCFLSISKSSPFSPSISLVLLIFLGTEPSSARSPEDAEASTSVIFVLSLKSSVLILNRDS